MRRSRLAILVGLVLVAFVLVASALAPATPAQASTWTAVQGGNVHYHAVDFFDAVRGWVGGTTYIPEGMIGFEDTGVISRTSSAGAKWDSVSSHELGNNTSAGWNFLTVTALDFVDDSHGWATLNDGTILVTTTGGVSWTVQATGSSGFADNNWGYPGLSMADATHGVAVGGWVGFIGTPQPRVAYTTNGTDWQSAELSTYKGAALESVHMVDAQHGWAVGTAVQADSIPLVLATADGGVTWARQTKGLPATGIGFHGVWFVDLQHGWAVGDKGAVYATADGGATWWSQPSVTSETLLDVCFAGPTVGWVVGDKGTILETTRSGSPWVVQTSGTTKMLRAVATAGMTVWAVGDEGAILTGSVPPPGPAGTGFSDISASPYQTAIESLAAAGIVNGFPDGTFKPDATVKRAQFAKMIVGVLGIVPGDSTATHFTDLGSPDSAGYPHRWVQTAFDHAITNGTNAAGTLFAPWDPIRRDQVVSMIARGAKSLLPGVLEGPPAGTPSLFANVGEPHGENLRIAEYNGLLEGFDGYGCYVGREGPGYPGRGGADALQPQAGGLGAVGLGAGLRAANLTVGPPGPDSRASRASAVHSSAFSRLASAK